MNKQMLIKIIGQRLSGREEEDMEDFIINEAYLVQRGTLEGKAFLPWFLSRVDVLALPENGELTLPEGFIREDEDESLYLLGDNQDLLLVKKDARDLYQKYHHDETGVPQYYAMVGRNKMQFFPKPDKEYEVRLSAYYHDVALGDLDSEGSNIWMEEAPNVLLNVLGENCAMVLRDTEAYQFFNRKAVAAMQDLEAAHLERRYVNQHMNFGG